MCIETAFSCYITDLMFFFSCFFNNLNRKEESAKEEFALRAHVPTCLTCLRAHVPTCLTYLRAHVLTCLTCLRAHVQTCLACLRAHVSTYLACLCAQVSTCFACSRPNVPCVLKCSRTCVPKCSRAITSNNKNKFSMTCFTYIFGTFSLSFSWEIKLFVGHELKRRGGNSHIYIYMYI